MNFPKPTDGLPWCSAVCSPGHCLDEQGRCKWRVEQAQLPPEQRRFWTLHADCDERCKTDLQYHSGHI